MFFYNFCTSSVIYFSASTLFCCRVADDSDCDSMTVLGKQIWQLLIEIYILFSSQAYLQTALRKTLLQQDVVYDFSYTFTLNRRAGHVMDLQSVYFVWNMGVLVWRAKGGGGEQVFKPSRVRLRRS
jgi:hypothetical protein